MDCLTKTEFEVATPWAFSAKHMYWPISSVLGLVITRVPRPGCSSILLL